MPETRPFSPGDVIVRREILDDREWIVYPVQVVADEPDVLAVYLHQGTPLSFGDGHFRWGVHPWAAFDPYWKSEGVLQLQRPGDWYSVWGRREGGRFAGWYVNFQQPPRRTERGFDTLDLELDLLIPADGSPPRWKDVDDFQARLAAGTFEPGQAEAVQRAATEVYKTAERGGGWWEAWRDWRTRDEWTVPDRVPLLGPTS
jgi:hypothetical protein